MKDPQTNKDLKHKITIPMNSATARQAMPRANVYRYDDGLFTAWIDTKRKADKFKADFETDALAPTVEVEAEVEAEVDAEKDEKDFELAKRFAAKILDDRDKSE